MLWLQNSHSSRAGQYFKTVPLMAIHNDLVFHYSQGRSSAKCVLCFVDFQNAVDFRELAEGICPYWKTLRPGRLHYPLWPSFHTGLIVLSNTWHPALPFWCWISVASGIWNQQKMFPYVFFMGHLIAGWKSPPPPVRMLVWRLLSNFIKYSMSRNKTEPCFCMCFLAEMVLHRLRIKLWIF